MFIVSTSCGGCLSKLYCELLYGENKILLKSIFSSTTILKQTNLIGDNIKFLLILPLDINSPLSSSKINNTRSL